MIERLRFPVNDADLAALAELLWDAVDSGASISFVEPFSRVDAAHYWEKWIALADAEPRRVILVARDELGITGSVQLHPAWAPNQPHRADVAKLLVHRRARKQGVGAALMLAVETNAREAGLSLLTLDTKVGDHAERLYERLGWTRAGVIPNYAQNPDRSYCDTVYFWKWIERRQA
jgi:GNAT superfamily N-acetyltransferase